MRKRVVTALTVVFALFALSFGMPMLAIGANLVIPRWEQIFTGPAVWIGTLMATYLLVQIVMGFGRRRAR